MKLWSLEEVKLLDFAIRNTIEYVKKMPKDLRKKYGQFFTSKETAIKNWQQHKINPYSETITGK